MQILLEPSQREGLGFGGKRMQRFLRIGVGRLDGLSNLPGIGLNESA